MTPDGKTLNLEVLILELVTAQLDPSARLVSIGLATRYSWIHA